jgi:hypothetical protein
MPVFFPGNFSTCWIFILAWDSIVVKALLLVRGLQDRSLVVLLGSFSVATDGTMCPGINSASKNEYQGTPGGKNSRCVPYHLYSAVSHEISGSLNLPNPKGLFRPVAGKLYLTFGGFLCSFISAFQFEIYHFHSTDNSNMTSVSPDFRTLLTTIQ